MDGKGATRASSIMGHSRKGGLYMDEIEHKSSENQCNYKHARADGRKEGMEEEKKLINDNKCIVWGMGRDCTACHWRMHTLERTTYVDTTRH